MVRSLHDELTRLVLDPANAPLLAIVKGIRNAIIYGSKVRFGHTLVTVFLFRSGTIRERLREVFNSTKQHARILATYVVVYKLAVMWLKNSDTGDGGRYDTFIAGLLGGYLVFGSEPGGINQQIVTHIFVRVVLATAKVAIRPGVHPLSPYITPEIRDGLSKHSWPVFAGLTWASVMYLFRWYPDAIQSSLRSTMEYIYRDSDHWDSLGTLFLQNRGEE